MYGLINEITTALSPTKHNIESESLNEKVRISKAVDRLKFTYNLLNEEDLIWAGEQKIKKQLGKAVLEIIFTDIDIEPKLMTNLLTDKKSKITEENKLITSISLGYMPDDSKTILYIGLASKPNIQFIEDTTLLTIIFDVTDNK